MRALPGVHAAIDELAMWSEDLRQHPPAPFQPALASPLDCFGDLPPLPPPPAGAGVWRPASPRPPGFPGGDRMHVHVTPAAGDRRGTIVLVPPWRIGTPGLVSRFVALVAQAGFDAWLTVPPHHAGRAADGARSGEAFLSTDVARIRASFEQLVLELRLLLAVAAAREGRTGILGLSLGALGAAFAATGPEPLDLAALVAPPDLATVVAETPIGARYRRMAARAGAPFPDDPAPLLAPFRPAARRPTARRIFVAAGRYDRVVPSAAPVALARAWGVAPRLYPRGHLTLLFACRELRRDLAAFLASA